MRTPSRAELGTATREVLRSRGELYQASLLSLTLLFSATVMRGQSPINHRTLPQFLLLWLFQLVLVKILERPICCCLVILSWHWMTRGNSEFGEDPKGVSATERSGNKN